MSVASAVYSLATFPGTFRADVRVRGRIAKAAVSRTTPAEVVDTQSDGVRLEGRRLAGGHALITFERGRVLLSDLGRVRSLRRQPDLFGGLAVLLDGKLLRIAHDPPRTRQAGIGAFSGVFCQIIVRNRTIEPPLTGYG